MRYFIAGPRQLVFAQRSEFVRKRLSVLAATSGKNMSSLLVVVNFIGEPLQLTLNSVASSLQRAARSLLLLLLLYFISLSFFHPSFSHCFSPYLLTLHPYPPRYNHILDASSTSAHKLSPVQHQNAKSSKTNMYMHVGYRICT